LSFTAAPTANAGADVTRCANNASVTLNGSVTIATGGVWSGGAGSYTPNNTTLSATYTPTATEISGGILTLTLTTTGNNNCSAVTDTKEITFSPAPTVDAGANGTVCAMPRPSAWPVRSLALLEQLGAAARAPTTPTTRP